MANDPIEDAIASLLEVFYQKIDAASSAATSPTDVEDRRLALAHAVSASAPSISGGEPIETTVERAHAFYDFLKGKSAGQKQGFSFLRSVWKGFHG